MSWMTDLAKTAVSGGVKDGAKQSLRRNDESFLATVLRGAAGSVAGALAVLGVQKAFQTLNKGTLTWEEAARYFVNERPNDSKIRKGAVLKEAQKQGQLIVQVFLDDNDQVVCDPTGEPYGRQLMVRRLDDELLGWFKDKNVIVNQIS